MQGLMALVGNQRSGKTYCAVQEIVDDLLPGGGSYYGNIAGLDYDILARTVEKRHDVQIVRSQFNPIPPKDIGEWFVNVPDGTTINGYDASIGLFIDECHLFFNALKRSSKILDVSARMCQLGKTGIAIRIIAPSYKQIDTQLRNQIQEIWLHTDAKRIPVLRMGAAFIPSLIACTQMSCIDGKATGEVKWVYKEQEIFACYKSFGVQSPDATRGKVTLQTLKKGKRARLIKWGKRAAILAGMCISAGGCYLDKQKDMEKRLEVLLRTAEKRGAVMPGVVPGIYVVMQGQDQAGSFAVLSNGWECRAGGPDHTGCFVERIGDGVVYVKDGLILKVYGKKPVDLIVRGAVAESLPVDQDGTVVSPTKPPLLTRAVSKMAGTITKAVQ